MLVGRLLVLGGLVIGWSVCVSVLLFGDFCLVCVVVCLGYEMHHTSLVCYDTHLESAGRYLTRSEFEVLWERPPPKREKRKRR